MDPRKLFHFLYYRNQRLRLQEVHHSKKLFVDLDFRPQFHRDLCLKKYLCQKYSLQDQFPLDLNLLNQRKRTPQWQLQNLEYINQRQLNQRKRTPQWFLVNLENLAMLLQINYKKRMPQWFLVNLQKLRKLQNLQPEKLLRQYLLVSLVAPPRLMQF